MQAVVAYIGLGSNLQEPQQQVIRAFTELDKIKQTYVLRTSSLYRSKPMGPSDQADYINAIAKIVTRLQPEELLSELHVIEALHQRERSGERWGPRTLDLDIILYGEEQINTAVLQIPHTGMSEREFVLIPLQEVDADLLIPGKGELSKLIAQLPAYDLVKI